MPRQTRSKLLFMVVPDGCVQVTLGRGVTNPTVFVGIQSTNGDGAMITRLRTLHFSGFELTMDESQPISTDLCFSTPPPDVKAQ